MTFADGVCELDQGEDVGRDGAVGVLLAAADADAEDHAALVGVLEELADLLGVEAGDRVQPDRALQAFGLQVLELLEEVHAHPQLELGVLLLGQALGLDRVDEHGAVEVGVGLMRGSGRLISRSCTGATTRATGAGSAGAGLDLGFGVRFGLRSCGRHFA